MDDKINKKIEEIYGKCTKGDLISVHEVYKAFNWALLFNADLDMYWEV